MTFRCHQFELLKGVLRKISETCQCTVMKGFEVFVVYGTREQDMCGVCRIQRFWVTRDGDKMAMFIYERLWPQEEIVDSQPTIPFEGHSRSGWGGVNHFRIRARDEIVPVQGNCPNFAFERFKGYDTNK
jgi:hypothetical protein